MTEEERQQYTRMVNKGMQNACPMSSDTSQIEAMFTIGDVVMLKGGSVSMTVSNYTSPTGTVECRWFKDGYVVTATFHQRSLKPVRWWMWMIA